MRAGRAVGALLGAALTALALVPGAAVAAADGEPRAALSVTTLEPRAAKPGDALVLRGQVRNPGAAPLRGISLRLRIAEAPVTTRSALAAQAETTGPIGTTVAQAGAAATLSDLAPGGVTSYSLTADLAALALPETGAYPLAVEVRVDRTTVARVRTWLAWTPVTPRLQPLSLAWLWPLVERPDRRADGTFSSDRLAAQVAPGGRLDTLVAAARSARVAGVPVTLAVDPALLESLAAMANGYLVRAPGQPAVRGVGALAAGVMLAALRPLATLDPVVALPYADPDVVALARAGRREDIAVASATTFAQLVTSILGAAPLTGVSWPPEGLVTRAALDAHSDASTVLLSGGAMPPLPTLDYTPDARAKLPAVAGGTLSALVSDQVLDRLVAAPPGDAGATRLAEQRFVAETLVIAGERPGQPRTLVILPPRRFAPTASWAGRLLANTGSLPWLRGTVLPAAEGTDTSLLRSPLDYPRAAGAAELPRAVLTGPGSVGAARGSLTTFRQVLTNPDDAGAIAAERALLRCESSAWRGDRAGQQALLAATTATLDAERAKVRITSSGEVTLPSANSTIPISVVNGLDQPVRVQLVLRSNQARLAAGSAPVATIAAGHQRQLEVRVEAPTAGVFPLYITLRTPEGVSYAAPVKIIVHSSRYGSLAIGITVGAFAVLVLAALWRLARRARSGRRVLG